MDDRPKVPCPKKTFLAFCPIIYQGRIMNCSTCLRGNNGGPFWYQFMRQINRREKV